MVSLNAVMVDGTYKKIVAVEGASQWEYTPRSSEEMQKIESLVKRAVNYNPDRGDDIEVVNIPFETNRLLLADQAATVPAWRSFVDNYRPYFKHIFIGLFLLLTFMFFVKPIVRWVTEFSRSDINLLQQLPKTVGELESEMGQDVKRLPSVDQVSEIISKDNEASLGVMRNWMNESRTDADS